MSHLFRHCKIKEAKLQETIDENNAQGVKSQDMKSNFFGAAPNKKMD